MSWGDPFKFPSRIGGIDRAEERSMLEPIGIQGFRTVIRNNPDGSSTRIKTRGGAVEIVHEAAKPVTVVKPIFVYYSFLFRDFVAGSAVQDALKPGKPPLYRLHSPVSSDGIIDLWQSEKNVDSTSPAQHARVSDSKTLIAAWHPQGGNVYANFSCHVEGGICYHGISLHGKVISAGLNTRVVSGAFSFPIRPIDNLTPDTQLVALPNPPAVPSLSSLPPGRSVLPRAILIGNERWYDLERGIPLGQYAGGANRMVYVAPSGERFVVQVQHACTIGWDVGIKATSTATLQISIGVMRMRPGSEPARATILNTTVSFIAGGFSGTTAAITGFVRSFLEFAPNGSKLVVTGRWGGSSNEINAADIRFWERISAAWEVTLAGGTSTTFPTASITQVATAHPAATQENSDYQPLYSSVISGIGYQQKTGETIYSGSCTVVRNIDSTPPFRYTAGGGEQTLMCAYDTNSELQVITYTTLQVTQKRQILGSIPSTSAWSYDYSTTPVTWIERPQFSVADRFETETTYTVSLKKNGAPLKTLVSSWTEVVETGSICQSNGGPIGPPGGKFDFGTVAGSSYRRTSSFGEYANGYTYSTSNNTLLFAQQVTPVEGNTVEAFTVVTPDALIPIASLPSSGSNGKLWVSWNPITKEITTTPGETWC